VATVVLAACSKADGSVPPEGKPGDAAPFAPFALGLPDAAPLDSARPDAAARTGAREALVLGACGSGRRMTLHFYDVGQALAVLVDLPDGRHVLVDTGDVPRRPPGCPRCPPEQPLLAKLRADLKGAPVDMVWITHPHSDHLGGAVGVLRAFHVGAYVDNGRDCRKAEVARTHRAAEENGVALHVVDPQDAFVPLDESPEVKLTAVVPPAWPPSCARDANECSIGLRIDFCASSVFFAGDAEHDEEAMLNPGRVTLLQVAHHGSETSTTPGFLAKIRPRYAVISAGKEGEGLNRDYCHPRALVVTRLTRVLPGGAGAASRPIEAFDGERCDRATPADWVSVEASDHLWATERDGDVVLSTTGDGAFERR
jgi:competence protein ComEC